MANASYDVIVIGAGPGGYPAAIRSAQLGLSFVRVPFRPPLLLIDRAQKLLYVRHMVEVDPVRQAGHRTPGGHPVPTTTGTGCRLAARNRR